MYIGQKLIQEVNPQENGSLLVVFEDGIKERLPKWEYDALLTEDGKDDEGEIRNKVANVAVGMILELFLGMEIKLSYLNHVVQKLLLSLNESEKAALETLYGVSEDDRRITDVDKVLRPDHYAKQEEAGQESKEEVKE